MFRTHQSQILSKRFESLAENMARLLERAPQTAPAYATAVRIPVANSDSKRKRSRRRNSIATGVSYKSTWY